MHKLIKNTLVISLFILCSYSLVSGGRNNAELFADSIYEKLKQFQDENGDVRVNIPKEVVGYLVIAAPYSIPNTATIAKIENGGLVNNKMVKLVQDDSAYHLFVISNNELIAYKKMVTSPVVFNDFFYAPLSADGLITFTLADKVLKAVKYSK
jgi:hypothetical protein